jgi:predicted nucleic acid-binding protein
VRRVLLDLNILLDVLLDRRPHSESSLALWAAALRAEIQVLFPAHGVTTVFSVTARQRTAAFAKAAVTELLAVASIAPVDDGTLRRALALDWPDFEDAVCAAAAEATSCDLLVTRDVAGFKGSPVMAVDPVTALSLIRGGKAPDRVGERGARSYGSKPAGRAKRRR